MSSVYVSGPLLLLALWLASKVVPYTFRRGARTTRLRGPPSKSLFFGLARYMIESPDISVEQEEWAARYGPVYEVPVAFGHTQVMLADPKALAHAYAYERAVYIKPAGQRFFIGRIFGRGVLWAEGDEHKRQRKGLTPAFSNAAIRRLTSVFYDSAYKLKSFWDAKLDSAPDGAIIEVQECLDSIGIAGFSHDFGYLEQKQSPVTRAFESLGVTEQTFATNLVFMLSFAFPFLLSVPTERMRVFWELRRSLNGIAQRLLANARRERQGLVKEELIDKSVIGLLLKDEAPNEEEVVAQWALIELAKHPDKQDKLRSELSRFGAIDPTWDQLGSDLPYLDATVSEILRLHPAVIETMREAIHDDVVPLGTPIVTPSGETISSIIVAKGSVVVVPIRSINRSEVLWGPDAKEFKPERWLDGDITVRAQELQGYRHLLTFHDGPRTCLGKSFALAEFKAVLSVLVRNFVFELPDGVDTKIDNHVAIVPRPKVAGQNGAKVPMRVKRVPS
ncbi:cytochrome P450 [Mycena vulgaris]|nr:cytochrome P450 [Mycena vulgaris]